MRGQLAPKEIPDANSSVSAASFRKIPFKCSICLWGGRGTNKQIKIRRRKKYYLMISLKDICSNLVVKTALLEKGPEVKHFFSFKNYSLEAQNKTFFYKDFKIKKCSVEYTQQCSQDWENIARYDYTLN